jgi:hypothetical protein
LDSRAFSQQPLSGKLSLTRNHPSSGFHSPSECNRSGPSLPTPTLAGLRLRRISLMRFVPLQRIRYPGAHITRVYLARFVPPSGLPPSRRLSSPETRPCFVPATLLGFSLQSFSLAKEPASSSDVRCPPAVTGSRFPNLPDDRFRSKPNSTSGPFSPSEVRHLQGGCYPLIQAGALVGFPPLQGFPPSRDGAAFAPPPRPVSTLARLAEAPRASVSSFGVFLNGKIGLAQRARLPS